MNFVKPTPTNARTSAFRVPSPRKATPKNPTKGLQGFTFNGQVLNPNILCLNFFNQFLHQAAACQRQTQEGMSGKNGESPSTMSSGFFSHEGSIETEEEPVTKGRERREEKDRKGTHQ